ncbi:MAG: hypothetical protein KDB72_10070 [Mycobacterium sp.]|nr:hypothetical protein [Mycobacterium sp.]
MSTTYAEPTATFAFSPDLPTGPEFAITPEYTATHYTLGSDDPTALAWSLSPLGDPAAEDDDLFIDAGEHHRESAIKIRTGGALAAIVLGAAGMGAAVGIAMVDFFDTPTLPAVVIPAANAPAPAPMAPHSGSPATVAPAPAQLVAIPLPANARPI